MKTSGSGIVDAITTGTTYKSFPYGRIWPSRNFFTAITDDDPVTGADATGFPASPMAQDIGQNGSNLYTFINDGGTLKVATNGSSTASSLSVSITGKPGVIGSTLYRIDSGNVYRHSITGWSPVAIDGGSNIGTPDETPLHVHGVSATRCVVLTSGSGGVRARVIDGSTEYKADDRFMFPTFVDYTSGSSPRTMDNLALYSGALELNGRVYIYISNVDGSVQGAYWDEDSLEWSNIFTAVPTNLQVSLCEFRIANAFEHGGVAYLAGQFHRTENIETDQYYSMILRSLDGVSFSVDRFSSVADLGYRFLAMVGSDNNLYLSNCNRVCYEPVVYTFDGNNGNGISLDIPRSSVIRFSPTDESANLVLKASDEYLLFHEYVQEGNKIEMFIGFETTSGSAGELYGTYIIEGTDSGIKDGVRSLSMGLLNEGHWKQQSHTSPFYTEFFGKSSLYEGLDEVTGNIYNATSTTLTRTQFFVDFWESEPLDDAANGVTGIDVVNNGAVDCYPVQPPKTTDPPTEIGAHKLGVKTKDIKNTLYLHDYPEITGTTVDAKLYGWSHPEGGAGNNDYVELCLVVIHADGTEENIYTNEDTRWPQTYPSSVAGENPITVTATGLTIGDKIKAIGVTFESANSTQFYIARVELTTNVAIKYKFDDPNTPWDFSTSGSGYEIPGVGRPYIMFGQKPYNSFNFNVAARFQHTVQGPISNYPTAVGLVGLAQDGNNFVGGRYDRSSNYAEIFKVRDGIETSLVYGTPSSGSPGEFLEIMFQHRNGHFTLYMKDGSGNWISEVEYDWTDTDGWMFTSDTVAMKCGFYGYLAAPSFRTTGINMSSSETSSSVDGIPHLPLESITDFPTSGQVTIDDSVYKYTSKVTAPTILRGPHQLRQYNSYSYPYGNGYGLECRDFYWTASTALINNKLIGVSNGSVFKVRSSSGALWKIFIKTGGVTYYQYQRGRYYSDNSLIAQTYMQTYMKVWVSGGLLGITKVSGPAAKHDEGALVQLYMTGTVLCHEFYGAGGDDDITVKDLIQKISAHAGVNTEFPGDISDTTLAISGNTLIGTPDYREGFDLKFETPTAVDCRVVTDATDPRYEGETGLRVDLNSLGSGNYRLSLLTVPSLTSIEAIDFTALDNAHKYRVLFHDNFASFYMDGKWIYTFCVPEIVYPVNNDVYIGGSFTASNVVLADLSDWREAIYIDLESDAQSAISSVIQERPIEIIWRYSGKISYWYDLVRDTITQIIPPRSHNWIERTPRNGASDAIVYGSDEVKCLQYPLYHQTYGFATKVMRFPNLKTGALKAAQIVLEIEFERRIRHSMQIRPDLRLEVGDILSVDYDASATGTNRTFDVIIESISGSFEEGKSYMKVDGREDV